MSADYPRDEPDDQPLDWPAYTRPDGWWLSGAFLAAALAGVLLFFALYG